MFFWINKVSDILFFNFWAGLFSVVPLACCVAPLSGFVSHWNTRQYSPLLVLIKIIIVKFLLKITTMKIQSDCLGIKYSRKRLTDVAFSRLYTYNTYIITHGIEMWQKIRNFCHLCSIKKSSKCGYFWVLLSLYNIQDLNLPAWGPHLEDFNI